MRAREPEGDFSLGFVIQYGAARISPAGSDPNRVGENEWSRVSQHLLDKFFMPEAEKHADQVQVANYKIECEAHIEAEAILGFQRVRDFKDQRDDEISKPAIDILRRSY